MRRRLPPTTRAVCYESPEHKSILAVAIVLMIMWPILIPVSYVLILFESRRAIIGHTPSQLSRACAFLHSEYEPRVRTVGIKQLAPCFSHSLV